MAFEPLKFTKSWTNHEDFPTYESSEEQVRKDLQLLHDEARDGLNRLIAALNDPSAAASMPFAPEKGLQSETVQGAILEVYAAIQNAAAGLLVDGSVTKEKLAKALLDRTYGGRVWVSMNTPDEEDNPDTDFPIGQLWLRRDFAADNLAAQSWQLTGCTGELDEDLGWLLTADGSLAEITASQTRAKLGLAGQQILVRLLVSELDEHLSGLTLTCNGEVHDLMAGGGVFETKLDDSGSLELTVRGQWPYAEAGAALRLSRLVVVNTDVVRQPLTDCEALEDWTSILEDLTQFDWVRRPREVYLQTGHGEWVQVEHEILPVSRGGTGIPEVLRGELLYGTDEDYLEYLSPGEDGSFLRISDGVPVWENGEQVADSTGFLRIASGSYTGSGGARTVALSVTPKLLFVQAAGGQALLGSENQRWDEPMFLQNGATVSESWTVNNGSVSISGTITQYTAKLSGSSLSLSGLLANRSGVAYVWTAIY